MTQTDITALARLMPLPPLTVEGCEALRFFGDRSNTKLMKLLRSGRLAASPDRAWSADRAALAAFYGCEKPDHFMATRPFNWFHASELQVTKGLATLLDEPGSQRLARIAAFLSVLPLPTGRNWSEKLHWAEIEAEARAGRARIDLLIRARGPDGLVGAVIEAKFEHHAAGNPFADYESAAAQLDLDRRNCAFLILAPQQTRSMVSLLEDSGNPWNFISWHRLFLALAKIESPQWDSEDFKRFRKTVFLRSI